MATVNPKSLANAKGVTVNVQKIKNTMNNTQNPSDPDSDTITTKTNGTNTTTQHTTTQITPQTYQSLKTISGSNFKLNNQPFHIEVGSIKTSPKLNIAETDMYLSGDDGKAYTYYQWQNTTGRIIKFTCYSRGNEKYVGDRTSLEETSSTHDTSEIVFHENSTPAEVLFAWSERFTKLTLDACIPGAPTEGTYIIWSLDQTADDFDFVKSEVELREYTQDDIEDSVFKTYDASELLDTDMTSDTALVKQIENLPVLEKSCSCTANTPSKSCTAPVSNDVKLLQRSLRRAGYFPTYSSGYGGKLAISGKFCYGTQQEVMKFQVASHLNPTGVFDTNTKKALLAKLTGATAKAKANAKAKTNANTSNATVRLQNKAGSKKNANVQSN